MVQLDYLSNAELVLLIFLSLFTLSWVTLSSALFYNGLECL